MYCSPIMTCLALCHKQSKCLDLIVTRKSPYLIAVTRKFQRVREEDEEQEPTVEETMCTSREVALLFLKSDICSICLTKIAPDNYWKFNDIFFFFFFWFIDLNWDNKGTFCFQKFCVPLTAQAFEQSMYVEAGPAPRKGFPDGLTGCYCLAWTFKSDIKWKTKPSHTHTHTLQS